MYAGCNRRHNEDPGPYLRLMRERYGEGLVEGLKGLKESMGKVTDEDLLRALDRLRAEAGFAPR
jgi:hypothetical protein